MPGDVGEVIQTLVQDNQQLMLAMNKVDTMMRMFPLRIINMDRLSSYEQDLKDIRNQFLEFFNKLLWLMQNIPKNVNGKKMNAECWQVKEQELSQRMTDHQVLNGKMNFSSIVSFCLKVEVLLQDLLDLADQDGCEQL